MKTEFNIDSIIKKGLIENELDYDRALIADRNLRLLSKEDAHFKTLRSKLRSIIEQYESAEWSDVDKIDDQKLIESDKSEYIAEQERLFIENRKNIIREKMKEADLTQENLASILGHKSKTHMSELMNGIKPFTIRDLVIINRVFNIDMDILIPRFLSTKDQVKVKDALGKLNKPGVKLSCHDLILC